MYLNLITSENKEVAQVTYTFSTPLILQEPHEIAVLAVDITQKFHNAPTDGVIQVRKSDGEAQAARFPKQVYGSIPDIVRVLNALMTSLEAKNSVKWVASRDEGIQATVKPGFAVDMNYQLQNYLKRHTGSLNNLDGPADVTAVFYPDILDKFRRIFLTCDQIEKLHHYEGMQLPILCSIPINQQNPEIDMLSFEFHNPKYYRLNTAYIERLTVKFTDELRRVLSMDKSGHCFVLAHLRPVQDHGKS